MKKYYILLILIAAVGISLIFYFSFKNKSTPPQNQSPTQTTTSKPSNNAQPPQKQGQGLAEPITDFKSRITKKPFGIYITPKTSPVQPEKFTGYHTGVDVEYTDVQQDVPVYAISQGEVLLSKFVSGYGGTLVISQKINNKNYLVLYGHLKPNSMINVGEKPEQGQKIGILGKGGTQETDFERKHLHFGILAGSKIDLRGYVQIKVDLAGWLDPLQYFK